MTELLIPAPVTPPRGDTFTRRLLEGYRPSVVPRYNRSEDNFSTELKHSKSDDLVLQSPPLIQAEIKQRCDSPIPKTASVVYEDDLVSTHVLPKAKYFSDSEADVDFRPSPADRAARKASVELASDLQRCVSRHVGLYDRVDPEDSIRDMITENDFYRFVLFKRHYDKYLHLSQKYEEARNIAYYLEEKYHEIKNSSPYGDTRKAERDGLSAARMELERKLESRELELHEKEEELFLQLERVVRLEEDCEKLRTEKEKYEQWKDQLEREKNEAYRQLKRQAMESEATRRGLERARQEVVRQVTAIAAEKDSLEREVRLAAAATAPNSQAQALGSPNEKLKETLKEERKGVGHYLVDLSQQKKRISQNVCGLEKEVSELKFIARQSASLNNQFKKGMKHLATCKRKKCSVCVYTKATFGEYADRNDRKLLSCFQAPLQDLRNWIRPVPLSASCSEDEGASCPQLSREGARTMAGSSRMRTRSGGSGGAGYSLGLPLPSPLPSTRSEYSFRRAYSPDADADETGSSPSPTPSLPAEADASRRVAAGLSETVSSCAATPCSDVAGVAGTSAGYISYIDEASSEDEGDDDSGSDSGRGCDDFFDGFPRGRHCCLHRSRQQHHPRRRCSASVPADVSLTSASSADPGGGNGVSVAGVGSSGGGARAFSSDSGFSSELFETSGHSAGALSVGHRSLHAVHDGSDRPPALHRSKWTSSFRKLINKVSKR
ncbi:uncharacterized protein LOC126259306 [Schistocerca nitens]|uniref:uncharacterized protein LOC126259306 n=1 Tax=Schistocerca nitens TaxID=7011 RepID=UPI0021196335|nr:uncharacterized protein LOC126259306 [Schistocerca nitens]